MAIKFLCERCSDKALLKTKIDDKGMMTIECLGCGEFRKIPSIDDASHEQDASGGEHA